MHGGILREYSGYVLTPKFINLRENLQILHTCVRYVYF